MAIFNNFRSLEFFSERDFRGEPIDAGLVLKLEKLAALWGEYIKDTKKPLTISPAAGSISRKVAQGQKGYSSMHNTAISKCSRAIDVFPKKLDKTNCSVFFEFAKNVGFTGIGLYPDTQLNGAKHMMSHLDVRPTALATWCRRYEDTPSGRKNIDTNIESLFI